MAGYPNPPMPRACSNFWCVAADVQTHPHSLALYLSPNSRKTVKKLLRPDAWVSKMSGKNETTQSGFSLQLSSKILFEVSSMISGGSTDSAWSSKAKAMMSLAVRPPWKSWAELKSLTPDLKYLMVGYPWTWNLEKNFEMH